jgi:hypothetical protein
MFPIYNYIKNFFIKEENQKVEITKEIWVENELQKWKLDLYSNNKYLQNIPTNRIINKRKELEKDYKKMFT